MTNPTDTRRDRAYGEILRLDELLDVACVRDEPDRTLFFAAHQACELWFAVILRHVESARDALTRDRADVAAEHIERLPAAMRVLSGHFDVLSTLTPESFDEIRATLGSSSGFQSAQYREIEFLCGARDPRFLNTPGFTPGERARLVARSDEQSLSRAFVEYRDRVRTDGGLRAAERVRAALAAFDDAVRSWRARHAELAEQFLGAARGTAGSAGAAYLWRSTERTLFPEIFTPGLNGGVVKN
ncbi:tryptophan 2,3-dioxygenase family protein [Verrucosispora sp. WMMD573]|uniref:tryptophan 2,3-dioxygenase family protein n=1 Tax=Verrucosispora sp. WMMD573 TaxID=3015149 RepID=UPI00248C613A|nr:tryptophan 2,3-dioxygenase family protein [Verrucosispora sp. WMMD573]WBB53411.1 tryptophan 2,3-dioxygenase family protein [Verrucosispora sp. WMMD573]